MSPNRKLVGLWPNDLITGDPIKYKGLIGFVASIPRDISMDQIPTGSIPIRKEDGQIMVVPIGEVERLRA